MKIEWEQIGLNFTFRACKPWVFRRSFGTFAQGFIYLGQYCYLSIHFWGKFFLLGRLYLIQEIRHFFLHWKSSARYTRWLGDICGLFYSVAWQGMPFKEATVLIAFLNGTLLELKRNKKSSLSSWRRSSEHFLLKLWNGSKLGTSLVWLPYCYSQDNFASTIHPKSFSTSQIWCGTGHKCILRLKHHLGSML